MDDDWLPDCLTDWLIDDKIMITRSVMMPKVSRLYRPTNLLFSNWIVSVIFHPIFDIWLEYAQQYYPKTCRIWILIFSFKFFYGFLITKNRDFWPLTRKKCLMSDQETWFRGILCVLPGVCKKWPLWAKLSGPFWPRIVPKLGQKAFFTYFAKGFHWI